MNNEAPSNHTGLNDSFATQSGPQSNPFTADLKGEFTSNFGTNTNAVSQIFKEGGFVNQNRTRFIVLGAVVVLFVAVAAYLFTGEEPAEEDLFNQTVAEDPLDTTKEDSLAAGEAVNDPLATAEELPTEALPMDTAAFPTDVAMTGAGTATSFGEGALSLVEPMDGATVNYDETQGPAVFSWSGGSGEIVFSRSATMTPEVLRIKVDGNSYSFHHPWPGNWYWQVRNASGSTEIRSFSVQAPLRRNVQVAMPSGPIAGNGGVVNWQGDGSVAYYRVEFSNGSWANPQFRFATTGTSVQLSGVPAGQYQMRVGAFSEVSGRWEYTDAVPVSVQ